MAYLEYTYGSYTGWDYSLDFIETPTKLNEELQVVMSEVQPSDEAMDIIEIYVELLFPSMTRHQREACSGCFNDHPSQIEHDVCCMMSKRTFLNTFLDNVRLLTSLS